MTVQHPQSLINFNDCGLFLLYGNDVSKKQLPNLFDVKERMRNFNDVMEGSVDDLKLPSTFENELGHLLGAKNRL